MYLITSLLILLSCSGCTTSNNDIMVDQQPLNKESIIKNADLTLPPIYNEAPVNVAVTVPTNKATKVIEAPKITKVIKVAEPKAA